MGPSAQGEWWRFLDQLAETEETELYYNSVSEVLKPLLKSVPKRRRFVSAEMKALEKSLSKERKVASAKVKASDKIVSKELKRFRVLANTRLPLLLRSDPAEFVVRTGYASVPKNPRYPVL